MRECSSRERVCLKSQASHSGMRGRKMGGGICSRSLTWMMAQRNQNLQVCVCRYAHAGSDNQYS